MNSSVFYENAEKTNNDMFFNLFECLRIQDDILQSSQFENFDEFTCREIIHSASKFASERIAPNYLSASNAGCEFIEGKKIRIPMHYYQQWDDFCSLGWGGVSAPKEYGGQGAPYILGQVLQEIFYKADTAFAIFSGFCIPGLYLIHNFGSESLRKTFCSKLAKNEWTASLVMTEPEAGSDIGNIITKARKLNDQEYMITGTKIFISAGEHDLSSNIVYFVLARTENNRTGTAGLSCFIVPKYIDCDDSGGLKDNGVRCVRLEEKMGLHACPTVQLEFGNEKPTIGYLLGEREGLGLKQLISLMNQARISTGIMAIGMSCNAYQYALSYAKERIQGTNPASIISASSERLPIIEHVDVRRMLLDMKARTEGCRALALRLAYFNSKQQILLESNQFEARRYGGLVDLLTPLLKAYSSDQGWGVCTSAIQVMGGYGYIADFPVNHWCRDIKVLSLWEGTNYMQAADLVRSKLALGRKSKIFTAYIDEIKTFLRKNSKDNFFRVELNTLADSLSTLQEVHQQFGVWLKTGNITKTFEVATRFLTIMAEITVGWLLLESAVVANSGLTNTSGSQSKEFYKGKIISAQYFINNILSSSSSRLSVLTSIDSTVESLDKDYL